MPDSHCFVVVRLHIPNQPCQPIRLKRPASWDGHLDACGKNSALNRHPITSRVVEQIKLTFDCSAWVVGISQYQLIKIGCCASELHVPVTGSEDGDEAAA